MEADMAGHITRYLRSNVLGLVAIFIALSGSAYAVGLAKNSVKAKHIKAGAVKTQKLANGAVTSAKVANGSLVGEDFAAGQLPPGPAGPIGPTGPSGERGPVGPTFAAAFGLDPVTNPDTVGDPNLITTPAAGRLFVTFTSPSYGSDCTNGILPNIGLYVDGEPVPSSRRSIPNGVPVPVDVFGVTGSVIPAGTHQLSVGIDCPGGDISAATINNGSTLGAILLGS